MLYNTGTIAINGNTATGTGTNWTAAASQVRAGQTIIVMSNPVQMFQISSVNSATSMTVTPAASPALSGQKYGILVSDNISVDGLAQAMSQLIKEYDENIGAWETFATTTANQNITVTINGTSVTIPGIGKLAQKGTNGALPIDQVEPARRLRKRVAKTSVWEVQQPKILVLIQVKYRYLAHWVLALLKRSMATTNTLIVRFFLRLTLHSRGSPEASREQSSI
jgi:hypothetical protein